MEVDESARNWTVSGEGGWGPGSFRVWHGRRGVSWSSRTHEVRSGPDDTPASAPSIENLSSPWKARAQQPWATHRLRMRLLWQLSKSGQAYGLSRKLAQTGQSMSSLQELSKRPPGPIIFSLF